MDLEPPVGTESGDEQAACLGSEQLVARIGPTRQVLGQAGVDPVGDGRLEQRFDQLG